MQEVIRKIEKDISVTEGFENILEYIFYNEPLSKHTTFKVGGNACVFICPPPIYFSDAAYCTRLFAKQKDIPLFILGGGSNVVFSDAGFRGIVLSNNSTINFPFVSGHQVDGSSSDRISFPSGLLSDTAAKRALQLSLCGLEFMYGLPGTIGGAVRMNARCFDNSVSDKIVRVQILNEDLQKVWVPFNSADWGYKKSPFQKDNIVVLEAEFKIGSGNKEDIENKMNGFLKDREDRGHFRFPSAGSVFKNNREHGKPAGKIIEELGLRGKRIGGAEIAPWHGNFIINRGGATASDIASLVELVQNKALQEMGFVLEPEIVFVN